MRAGDRSGGIRRRKCTPSANRPAAQELETMKSRLAAELQRLQQRATVNSSPAENI